MARDECGESGPGLQAAGAPPKPAGPVLTLEPSDALPQAAFHLVSARIEWSDGAPTQGWGRDADAQLAQLKAVAEAVERSAWLRLPAGAFEAAANALQEFVAPTGLVRYAPWQYAQPGFPFQPFRTDEARWWVSGAAADDGRQAALVADCVCNPRAFDAAYGARLLTYATTSGCASGRGTQDALERALLELLERDAFLRHWFAQAPGRAVVAGSLPGWAAQRLRRLQQGGCEAGVQCLTAGVHPAWFAWARHQRLHFTCVGAASGLDAEAALAAALQEMETIALARLEGVPAEPIAPEQVRTPADHGALYATPGYFRRADGLLRATTSVGFGQAAAGFALSFPALLRRLQAAGHPVWCVDMSVPEAQTILAGAPIRTVRALVPGLIPIAFGQRLQALGMVDAVAEGALAVHPFS